MILLSLGLMLATVVLFTYSMGLFLWTRFIRRRPEPAWVTPVGCTTSTTALIFFFLSVLAGFLGTL